MKKRIATVLLLTCTVIMAAFAAAVLLWTNHQFVENEKLDQDAYLRSVVYTAALPENFELFAEELAAQMRSGTRVTVLEPDGSVAGDSQLDAAAMENHAARPEVAAALSLGFGQDVRLSESTGVRTIYSARPWEGGYVLRMAFPLPDTGFFVVGLLPAILLIYAGLLALLIPASRRLAALAMRPYSRLDGEIVRALQAGTPLDLSPYRDENLVLAENFQHVLDELIRYQKQARTEAQRIEAIVSGIQDGVALLDRSGEVILCNRPVLDFLELDALPEERHLARLCRERSLGESIDAALHAAVPSTLDLARNGRIYRLTISPSAEGAMLLLSDVSELVRLEQARSSFTANVSHELKTPLTAISGFSELIAEGLVTDPNQIRQNMRIVCTEAKRMTKLVEDILHLSALETLNGTGEERADIGEVFRSTAALLIKLSEEKGVQVNISGSCRVKMSAEHGAELAGNLLSNAIRYNRRGGTVDVVLWEDAGTGHILVRDTGIGIPEEHLGHIFERFYRVDKDRSRSTGGTGLGLAIVKHLVELYEGGISVDSGDDGTVFTVRLPQ